MTKISLSNGQSLVEVIVALAVVGLIAIGLVRISSLSLKNTRYSNEETEAVALAEKKIAELKTEWVNDENKFLSMQESGPSDQHCYLIILTDVKNDPSIGLPTLTTPNYSQAKLYQAKVAVYWGLKDVNPGCSSEGVGAQNYDHKIDITTLLAK